MKVLGIIAEYNPFHNGHLYQLKKAKALFKPTHVIVLLSGSFVQRGEPAIMSKWDRAELALRFGADLVIELPAIFSTMPADIYADKAIEALLSLEIIDIICAGIEADCVEDLHHIARVQIEKKNDLDKFIKHYLEKGYSYNRSMIDSLKHFIPHIKTEDFKPNNQLFIQYAKSCIRRNFLHLEGIERASEKNITSASNIRLLLKNQSKANLYLPYDIESYETLDQTRCANIIYQYLKIAEIKGGNNWSALPFFEFGMDKLLNKAFRSSSSLEQLLEMTLSKRYSRNRINRFLTHQLLNITKQDLLNALTTSVPVKMIGANHRGIELLKSIKDKTGLSLSHKYPNHTPASLKVIEHSTTDLHQFLIKDKYDKNVDLTHHFKIYK